MVFVVLILKADSDSAGGALAGGEDQVFRLSQIKTPRQDSSHQRHNRGYQKISIANEAIPVPLTPTRNSRPQSTHRKQHPKTPHKYT